MTRTDAGIAPAQRRVDEKFHAEARKWSALYEQPTAYGRVIRHRHALALAWVDGLNPRPDTALEAGCGAGVLAADLAERGLRVQAIDSVSRMVDLTRERLLARGLAAQANAQVGDVNRLPFPDSSFELVTALGVLDWVPSPARALSEMARVLHEDGYLICSAGHPAAFAYLIDPLKNPVLEPARRLARQALELLRLRHPRSSQQRIRIASVDRLVASVGLQKLDWRTVGFGPLTFLRYPIVPEPIGIRIQVLLQRMADTRVPIVGKAGMGYMLLARKGLPTSRSFADIG